MPIGQAGRVACVVNKRHPEVAETMVDGMVRGPAECFRVVRSCAQTLTDAGFEMPPWRLLAEDKEAVRADNPEPNESKFGQHGPLASSALTAVPTHRMTKIDPSCSGWF